jgi:hypothetical protein
MPRGIYVRKNKTEGALAAPSTPAVKKATRKAAPKKTARTLNKTAEKLFAAPVQPTRQENSREDWNLLLSYAGSLVTIHTALGPQTPSVVTKELEATIATLGSRREALFGVPYLVAKTEPLKVPTPAPLANPTPTVQQPFPPAISPS